MFASIQQLRDILSARDRWIVALLLLGMLIVGALEATSVGAVPLFVRSLTSTNPETVFPKAVTNFVGDVTQQPIALIGGAVLITIVLMKNVCAFVVNGLRVWFVKHLQWRVTQQICRNYIDADFEFHMQNTSYRLMRNANVETQIVINRVLTSLMVVAMNLLAAVCVLTALFWMEPAATALMFLVVASSCVLFIWSIRTAITRHARNALTHRAEFINRFNMVVGSLPEIRILGREDYFHDKLSQSAKVTADSQRFRMLGSMAIMPYIESVVTISFACVIWFLVARNPGTASPALAMVAVGFMRLRGQVVAIMSGVTQLHGSHVSVGPVWEHLQLKSERAQQSSSSETTGESDEIRMSNVSYRYPTAKTDSLTNASFKAQHGDIIGVVGPSGSGKTTLVKILLGLIRPKSGTFEGFGIDVNRTPDAWQTLVGYVPQNVYLLDGTIEENIAFGVRQNDIDRDRIRKSAERAQIMDFIDSLPDGFQAQVGEFGGRLSGGQKQRLGIARALYAEPDVLILDEITSSLDAATEARIVKEIQDLKGVTTFFVTHKVEVTNDFNRILCLDAGHVTENSGLRLAG